MIDTGVRIFMDENGNKLKLEVIEDFRIEQNGKNYIAYSVNDDGSTDKVKVNFMELINIDTTPGVKPVDPEDVQLVIDSFNKLLEVTDIEM